MANHEAPAWMEKGKAPMPLRRVCMTRDHLLAPFYLSLLERWLGGLCFYAIEARSWRVHACTYLLKLTGLSSFMCGL